MNGARCRGRYRIATLAVVALAAVGLSTPPSSAATNRAAAPTSSIAWQPCHKTFQCARVPVPLDYDDPGGRQISLALIKQAATDPAHRLGSLFVNPGGPGGSGVDFVLYDGHDLLTPQVRARFDIIGFDPRGIARSNPLRCFSSLDQAASVVPPFPYPDTAAKRAVWFADDHAFQAACAQRDPLILDHMATADAARDLDVLRRDVGDAGLNYYGVSYGSFLGDTYANLFPDHVRSLVIDGVLDPVAWTTGSGDGRSVPFTTRLHTDVAMLATLHEFFRLCDAGGRRCAFAPDAASRYAALYQALRRHPLLLPGAPGAPISYDQSFLVADTLGAMYSSSEWPSFAHELHQLEKAVAKQGSRVGAAARAAAAGAVVRLRAQLGAAAAGFASGYPNYVEGFPGVACSDAVDPTHPSAWTRAAAEAERADGIFGPIWTWLSSVCSRWPGHDDDRYLGPFTHRTSHPVLVVGNIFDPVTAYAGALAAARLLPNSRLLTVHGWGHTSLFISTCATAAIGRYLITSTPPAPGTVCEQDDVPFQHTGSSSGPATSARAARLRR